MLLYTAIGVLCYFISPKPNYSPAKEQKFLVILIITFHIANDLLFPKLRIFSSSDSWAKDSIPVFSVEKLAITKTAILYLVNAISGFPGSFP